MHTMKKSLAVAVTLLLLFLIGCILTALPTGNIFLLRDVSSVYFICFGVTLLLYFSWHIIDKRIRRCLIAVGIMAIFWFFIRIEKYAVFEENDFIVRQLWYLYYVPMIMTQQFSFKASLSVGKGENEKLPKIHIITYMVSVLSVLIVLSNDFHQLVFGFDEGFTNFSTHYSHEALYWFIFLWIAVLFLSTVAILVYKCRLSVNKKLAWIPVCYVLIFVIWLVLILLDTRPQLWGENIGEFAETACFMQGGFWIICMEIGLLPSNKGYKNISDKTSLAVLIADKSYKIIYRSKSSADMSKEQMTKAEPFMIDDNNRVYRKTISGGYAYYQTDITELNRVNAELNDIKDMLSEENELIRLSNELKRKQVQIATKSKVYDDIASKVLPQSIHIADLSRQIQKDNTLFFQNMKEVSICASFIKRMSNLMLIASQKKYLERKELELAIAESLRYLSKAGIISCVNADSKEIYFSSNDIIGTYELFENLLEQSLPSLRAISVTFIGYILKLTFEGAVPRLPKNTDATYEADEDTAFIRINIGKSGDRM